MSDKKNILLIGYGAIGTTVASAMQTHERARITHVLTKPGREKAAQQALGDNAHIVSDLSGFLLSSHHIDVVADCAGHGALASYGPELLAAGIDVYSLSCGAMADTELANNLQHSAQRGGSQLKLLSGAIGGLDALSAGAVGTLEKVRYRGRKPPTGWAGSAAEKVVDLTNIDKATIHFSGNARLAASGFPKNANVAASVALAGVGMEHTDVELIVDPAIDVNVHEIEARGEFGSLTLRVEGYALMSNPRSSALAAFSMISALNKRYATVSVGV